MKQIYRSNDPTVFGILNGIFAEMKARFFSSVSHVKGYNDFKVRMLLSTVSLSKEHNRVRSAILHSLRGKLRKYACGTSCKVVFVASTKERSIDFLLEKRCRSSIYTLVRLNVHSKLCNNHRSFSLNISPSTVEYPPELNSSFRFSTRSQAIDSYAAE
jgi:hypothetical protein